MLIAFSLLGIVLLASGWVTGAVMRNIDRIGALEEIKTLAISKALFNFYAMAVLCVVVAIRYLKLVETELFIALLVVVLGGLGFKLTMDLKQK